MAVSEGRLLPLLKAATGQHWTTYVHHDFVRGLGDGTLPLACFRHYLVQDYLFLVNYARAYALAVYKGETIDEMRHAVSGVTGLLQSELQLHLNYCQSWGLSEADVLATPEHVGNMAYTRYVMERGAAGDYLDLMVALAPCAVGYAEIGERLLQDPGTQRANNPYLPWIESYGGAAFHALASDACLHMDQAAERRIGADFKSAPRFAALAKTFEQATRLEVGFWDMGMSPPA